MGKVRDARKLLAGGNFKLPSPQEVEAAKTPAGAWTAKTLAGWGVPWPPERGWRQELALKWRQAQHESDRWNPEVLAADVAFTLSDGGQMRRTEREIAYAEEIVRLRAEIERPSDELPWRSDYDGVTRP